ncbi:MAG: hypothetical protein ACR2QL_08070 [Woeseiaceae bacterium]
MSAHALSWLVTGLVAIQIGGNLARADAADSAEFILPTDPRFNVLELSNSGGDRPLAGVQGTVLLSFASEDLRYCRAARFPADKTVVLACREEGGWK